MKYLLVLIAALSLLLLAAASPQAAAEPEKMTQADTILASPSLDFPKAQSALVLYEDLLQGSPQLMTRLARACFILGGLAPVKERGIYYDKGLHYADKLLAQEPDGVAGFYWKAMNLSGLADVGSEIVGFKLLPQIVDALKRVLIIDETYDAAGAHRVLGRIYFQAPAWPISVGDKKQSLTHLTSAVRLAPNYSTNHLYLGETLLDMKQNDQAQAEFEKVLQDSQHALTPQDLEDNRREARRLLGELKKAP